jgi:hypothetical protein
MVANSETHLRIAAHNTPSGSDPPDADRFYAALGMLSVAWGRLEGHTNGNVLTIINLLGRGHEKIALFPWDRRARLWNEGFSSLPALKAREARAAAFMQSITEAADDRNFAAHAIWGEFDRHATEPTMTARWIKTTPGTPGVIKVDDRRITLSMVYAALAECNGLNLEMAGFTKLIAPLRAPPAAIRRL